MREMMRVSGLRLALASAMILAAAGLCILLNLVLHGCAHQGLPKAMADGSLAGCVEWARAHNDPELEALCRAGRPLTEILDLFSTRAAAAQRPDGGPVADAK